MKRLTILGTTGSIGTQTIDVVYNHQDMFTVVAISAGHNITLLEEIINKLPIKHICVIEKKDALYLENKYPDCHIYWGDEGLKTIATLDEVDMVLNGIVGFAGLLPTIEAIKCHKDIALANKETLVAAGHIIMPLVKEYNVSLIPVDSEHSAIFQSLNGENKKQLSKIILTASGGSFREKTREQLKDVTIEQALTHPNWSMGAKITVDSSTLFNKGLEVIEARWLFDVDYDQIEVLIHPESIVHSMVEYQDGAVKAQLGVPDMRLPIQYALTYPDRFEIINSERLDLSKITSLHFYKPDFERYKSLKLAYQAGRTGGSMPCVLNGANEMANALFREGRIAFLDIEECVEAAMKAHQVVTHPSLEKLIEIDAWARDYVKEYVRCRQL